MTMARLQRYPIALISVHNSAAPEKAEVDCLAGRGPLDQVLQLADAERDGRFFVDLPPCDVGKAQGADGFTVALPSQRV
jgi:hypothetical protein